MEITNEELAEKHNVTIYDDNDLHEIYDNMLDEIYGEVLVAGLCLGNTSEVLKRCDNTAYRTGFVDWLDGESQFTELDDGTIVDTHELDEANDNIEDEENSFSDFLDEHVKLIEVK